VAPGSHERRKIHARMFVGLGLNPLNRSKIKQTEVPKGSSPENDAEEALISREASPHT